MGPLRVCLWVFFAAAQHQLGSEMLLSGVLPLAIAIRKVSPSRYWTLLVLVRVIPLELQL